MNTSNKFGLKQTTIDKINSVFKSFPAIEKVILYGSRAMGNFKDGSDIDLTVIAPTLSTKDLLKLENLLEELMLAYKIDLSLYHQLDNPELIEHIKRVGTIFWSAKV